MILVIFGHSSICCRVLALRGPLCFGNDGLRLCVGFLRNRGDRCHCVLNCIYVSVIVGSRSALDKFNEQVCEEK